MLSMAERKTSGIAERAWGGYQPLPCRALSSQTVHSVPVMEAVASGVCSLTHGADRGRLDKRSGECQKQDASALPSPIVQCALTW